MADQFKELYKPDLKIFIASVPGPTLDMAERCDILLTMVGVKSCYFLSNSTARINNYFE
jgi:hypothetical protein